MMHNWHYLIDIIFPPSADYQRLQKHSTVSFLKHYRPTKVDDTWALSQYLDPTIKAAITECKYQHNHQATALLATLLNHWLATQPTVPTVLIPIPLSAKRERKRGYNQVETVCQQLTKLIHLSLAADIIYRTRDTKPQTTLPRAKRLKNMDQAFAIRLEKLNRLKDFEHIIICDDVLTTGATLNAAKDVLLPHLPAHSKLSTVAWAH